MLSVIQYIINFLQCHKFTVTHFINNAAIYYTARRTIFTADDINTTKLKGVMKNQEVKDVFFKIFDNIHI